MKLRNLVGHLNMVNSHRFMVFKLSIKAGIPFRGLIHDLSKYHPIEFFEGVKYFDGKISPIKVCKKKEGYSKAWLHHKGRNKHHFEYWYDFNTPDKTPIIPYKYVAEMICDNLAASLTYNKKNWSAEDQLNYFLNRTDLEYLNEKVKNILIEVYEDIVKDGINKTITSKNLKRIYKKHIK